MNDDDRGKIRHRDWARRLRDFSGLRFGMITPTDIDGFIDYRNEIFFLIEVKKECAEMPRGQELALERLCDATIRGGVRSFVLVASYRPGPDIDEDIDVANARLMRVRMDCTWKDVDNGITVRRFIDRVLFGAIDIEEAIAPCPAR